MLFPSHFFFIGISCIVKGESLSYVVLDKQYPVAGRVSSIKL